MVSGHTIVVIPIIKIFFLYSYSLYSCHFLISSASVRSITISVVYRAHPCMKYSLDISSFLADISSLSHSIVFFYFFALFIEEGLFSSPCYFLELCIQLGISFPFSLAFCSPSFSAMCKASSGNHFAFSNFFFFGIVLVTAYCTAL